MNETALVPPVATAAAAVAAAQVDQPEEEKAPEVDLAPVSKKGLSHPARPGPGTVTKKVVIRTNHFLRLDKRSFGDGAEELAEELPEPDALGDSIGHATVLRLRTGTRHRGLALRGPRDERVAKVHAVPRGGAPRIRAARPIGVSVDAEIQLSRGVDVQPHVDGTADVPESTLDQPMMALTGIMHVQAYLLHGVGELGTRDGQVLECAGDAPVCRRVGDARTIGGGQLGLGVNGRGGGATVVHGSTLQNILRVLLLGQEEAARRACHPDAEEEVQSTKVLHGELAGEACDDALEQSG